MEALGIHNSPQGLLSASMKELQLGESRWHHPPRFGFSHPLDLPTIKLGSKRFLEGLIAVFKRLHLTKADMDCSWGVMG